MQDVWTWSSFMRPHLPQASRRSCRARCSVLCPRKVRLSGQAQGRQGGPGVGIAAGVFQCKFLVPVPDGLRQNFWGRGSRICIFQQLVQLILVPLKIKPAALKSHERDQVNRSPTPAPSLAGTLGVRGLKTRVLCNHLTSAKPGARSL